MKSSALLWFKNDLRLHDNEALTKATHSGLKVLPIYIFDPRSYRKINYGFPKGDRVRLNFAMQCVSNLRKNLKAIRGDLMILTGHAEKIIPKLVEEFNCEIIFAEQEFATEELNLIKRIDKQLTIKCKFDFSWGRSLFHLNDIPYQISEIPHTSKAFRINTTKKTAVRQPMLAPSLIDCVRLSDIRWGALPNPKDLGFEGKSNYALTYVKGGETEGLKRLDYYSFETELLSSYRWTRNRSLGMDFSSKFSPYLALGCLSPRTIYQTVKNYESEIQRNQSTWWLIFELIWRDYFTFKLMRFKNLCYKTEGYTNKFLLFCNDPELFARWCKGTTGVPFVDAHMRQLNETGYMSNRGRVNCASFLVHDYHIDWTWGAAYFESKLIDYDVASNWMNWHAQTYQVWYTNPINQANKYKAQNFIRKWVEELRNLDDLSTLIPWEFEVPSYPKPHQITDKWKRSITKIKKDHPGN